MIRYLLVLLVISCHTFFALGQKEMGMPFIQHYLPADYNAGSQNWDLIQDDNGLIYVGNNKGILQYDGKHWELILTSNNSTVRSLGKHQGIIYVGAEGELGYLQPSIMGDLQYHSLLPYLDSAYHDFNITWSILANHEGVYFRTSKYLLRWADGKFKVWKPKSRFGRSFIIQDRYYIQERMGSLMYMDGDELIKAPNGEQTTGMNVQAIFPYEADKLLVLPNSKDAHILELKENGDFSIFESEEINAFCKSGIIYDHAILTDGTYVACTIGNGAIVFTKEGKIVQRLNKKYGLADEVMICLYTDQEGGLWTGLNTGIAHIEMTSPFRVWDDKLGLEGAAAHITRFNGKLYTATVQGLYVHNGQEFEAITGISDQTWEVLPFQHGNTNKLMVANYLGLFELETGTNTVRHIAKKGTIIDMHQKQDQPDLLFAAGVDGLYIFKDNNGTWQPIQTVTSIDGDLESICEDEQHHIWISSNTHRIYRLEFPNQDYSQEPVLYAYDELKGIPDADFTKVTYLQHRVLATTEVGILAYNSETDAFEPYTKLGEVFAGGDVQVYSIQEGKGQDIWIASLFTSSIVGKVSYKNQQPTLFSAPFKRLPKTEMYSSYYEPETSSFWLCTDKLYRFEDQSRSSVVSNFNTLIRHVAVNDDSTIFWGNNFDPSTNNALNTRILAKRQAPTSQPTLSYADNTLTFEYAATSFNHEEANQFSYQLIGHDDKKEWSSWSSDTKKQYTDLFEGDYTFRVKAKNIFGIESEVASYQFSITPPWYRHPVAYFTYVLFAFLLIFLITEINARRILIEKRYLERVVEERTKEIQHKNEEITLQNSTLLAHKNLIEKKNKDTLDSIRYAERILNALHVRPSKLKAELPNSFVLCKPRDIVSGDFFWVHKEQSQLIIAAIDCTGHGIPGAFMSVIGQSLLKETVTMYGIMEVDEILHALHSMLSASLKREKGSSIEGMDMTICSIDFTTRKVHFAGAKNPLVYIHNNELKMIKGDKLPVGGIRPDEERNFVKHTIPLQDTPTVFYMFSDGFQDQFGGKNNRKFMPKRFRQLLLDIHQLDFQEQETVLEKRFEEWKGAEKQLDDVLVLGFRL